MLIYISERASELNEHFISDPLTMKTLYKESTKVKDMEVVIPLKKKGIVPILNTRLIFLISYTVAVKIKIDKYDYSRKK